MKRLTFLCLIVLLGACQSKKTADVIVTNAKVYTVNSSFDTAEAFAIKDGKFLAVGDNNDILAQYEAHEMIDAQGKTILPGFIDAHCHFYGLGLNQNRVDLRGTKSFDDMMKRVLDFYNKQPNPRFIIGGGWDHNDWEEQEFPDNKLLNALFPNTPVALTRIDGHAMLCNQTALNLAGITVNSTFEGGSVEVENGVLTGILIDEPMEKVRAVFPKPSKKEQIEALLNAQQICLDYGLTTVSDAGLDKEIIALIDSLQHTGDLSIRVYAMIANSKENLAYYLSKGPLKTDRLNVRSVKVYADGALGSRGAALKAPYHDLPNHYGKLMLTKEEFEKLAKELAETQFQMNTHAIGDSANRVVLQTYKDVLQGKHDKRWRVEHAQILTDNDIQLFKDENIIPSVQPTHATSDMYWAENRIGKERLKQAYAYKDLLNISGKVALGTDFPVEQVNPFLTFYAAVARQDVKGFPEGGFQKENALSREEALKGMTIWAAYANFEAEEKGSIEVGKWADFIVIDKDMMTIPIEEVPNLKVEQTFVAGVSL